jgi:hypothetical protein
VPQIRYWLNTGYVAANKIVSLHIPELYAIVRGKVGKTVEFGLVEAQERPVAPEFPASCNYTTGRATMPPETHPAEIESRLKSTKEGNMKMILLVPFLVAVSMGTGTGCATSHGMMRGSVVMKTSETEAHVCLGKGEVAVGDDVSLYRNVCPTLGEPTPSGCHREALGRGKVEKVLDDHYSVVRFPAGVTFKDGDTVEKGP